MAQPLTKSQITVALAETVGLTKTQATEALEALVGLAYKNAKNKFTVPGLGKLVLVNRKARMGRNPATGASIKIPAKRVVKFRIAKAAKDAILGPSNAKSYEHYDIDATRTRECGLRIENGARQPFSRPIAENPMNTDVPITTST